VDTILPYYKNFQDGLAQAIKNEKFNIDIKEKITDLNATLKEHNISLDDFNEATYLYRFANDDGVIDMRKFKGIVDTINNIKTPYE
jgi:hypothetical protein